MKRELYLLLAVAVIVLLICYTVNRDDKIQSSIALSEKNKEIVKKFMTFAFIQKDVKAAAEMLTEGCIQHNLQVHTGKMGFLNDIPEIFKMFPDLNFKIINIWSEDDFVIMHSYCQFKKESKGNMVVDIFRMKGGKIVEHWDVIQPIPEKMVNNNGVF